MTVRPHRSNKRRAATQQELVDKFGQCMQFLRLNRSGETAMKRDLGVEAFSVMSNCHAKNDPRIMIMKQTREEAAFVVNPAT